MEVRGGYARGKKLRIELFEIRNDCLNRHVRECATVGEIFHVAAAGEVDRLEQAVGRAIELKRRDVGARAQGQSKAGVHFTHLPSIFSSVYECQ